MNEPSFQLIIDTTRELAEWFPDGIIFIGGVATYLHAQSQNRLEFLETSHDSDFFISLADFADLRDIEEVQPNRRLSKYQLIKNQVEFDIYLENQHKLCVPYQQAQKYRVILNQIPCVCLEHLLVLKIDAGISRYGSSKGNKDQRDIIRILALMSTPNYRLVKPYLDDQRQEYLQALSRQLAPFQELTQGNSQKCSFLRKHVQKFLFDLHENHSSSVRSTPRDLEAER